jgi:hypothetical protein
MSTSNVNSNNKSSKKNIRFEHDLIEQIEQAKDPLIPFAAWVKQACRDKLNGVGAQVTASVAKPVRTINKDVRTSSGSKVDNSYAALNGLPSNITEELHAQIMKLNGQGLTGPKIAEITQVSKSSINRVISASK